MFIDARILIGNFGDSEMVIVSAGSTEVFLNILVEGCFPHYCTAMEKKETLKIDRSPWMIGKYFVSMSENWAVRN